MELVADFSFVIDLERERHKGNQGRAHEFLRGHGDDYFFITFTVAGELACGDSAEHQTEWRRLCEPYGLIEWKPQIAFLYGVAYRRLRRAGTLIGTNDLWIAATCLSHGLPLVTRNKAEFERVPDLHVLTY